MLLMIAGMAARLNEQYLWQQYFWARYAWGHALTLEQVQALKPGSSFRECAQDPGTEADVPRYPEYSVHYPGSFAMGSETGGPDERPVRTVRFTTPFAVSKFEITAEQWRTCVTYGGCKPGGGEDKQPANSVNWEDVQHFVAWLSKITGHEYWILSEAEWKYAARAGTTSEYWWGDARRRKPSYAMMPIPGRHCRKGAAAVPSEAENQCSTALGHIRNMSANDDQMERAFSGTRRQRDRRLDCCVATRLGLEHRIYCGFLA